ncbi:host attachment protein [Acidocella sp. KAb 2-4]|uniref:baeRF12 domain-containing protein n=1 Tax=Acidocella sp. KAb 2-4 TaxID=2885158 RepID=UPI001D07BEC7|nr:host attachment protein [Acidocella sp. KAb 2-4]MCB5943800.1 host attachment family protein [Acidocella sp. KAb 2-4]
MSIHLKVLFALANGEHARFVRPTEEDNTLHSSSRVVPEDGHPGAASHTHAQDKNKFAAWVAEQLNQHVSSYDELVLVAPAHTLSVIREHLNKQAAAKVVGSVDKDLAKTADGELWPHIRQWVRPVHRQKVI